jgi:hypothetical protein
LVILPYTSGSVVLTSTFSIFGCCTWIITGIDAGCCSGFGVFTGIGRGDLVGWAT